MINEYLTHAGSELRVCTKSGHFSTTKSLPIFFHFFAFIYKKVIEGLMVFIILRGFGMTVKAFIQYVFVKFCFFCNFSGACLSILARQLSGGRAGASPRASPRPRRLGPRAHSPLPGPARRPHREEAQSVSKSRAAKQREQHGYKLRENGSETNTRLRAYKLTRWRGEPERGGGRGGNHNARGFLLLASTGFVKLSP